MRERTGLAGAGSGQQQQRPGIVLDRQLLHRVELGEKIGHLFLSALPIFPQESGSSGPDYRRQRYRDGK